MGYTGSRRPGDAETFVRFHKKWGKKGENGMSNLKKNGKMTCKVRRSKRREPQNKETIKKSKFSTVVRHGGNLGPRPRRVSPSVYFYFYGGCVLADRSPPPLEWLPFPPLVAAVLVTPQSAESPGSGRIGVIGASVFFLTEAV